MTELVRHNFQINLLDKNMSDLMDRGQDLQSIIEAWADTHGLACRHVDVVNHVDYVITNVPTYADFQAEVKAKVDDDVYALLTATIRNCGCKISSIKFVHNQMGWSLTKSKEVFENWDCYA